MIKSAYKVITCLVLLVNTCLGLQTLVLHETESTDDFSLLLNVLKTNDLEYVTKQIDSEAQIDLFDVNNNLLFDNLIVLPNRAKSLAANIDQNSLLKFSHNGGNVLIVSQNSGTQLDEVLFLNQLGIYPSPKGFKYVDYHDSPIKVLSNENIISSDASTNDISINDAAVAILSNSEFLIPLIQTSKTSFTYNPDKGETITDESTWHSGNQGYALVSFQGLNNARVSWSGMSKIFTNENFNQELVNDLIQWTFQLKSVIKATVFNHKRVDSEGLELPFIDGDDYYKIKDETYFEIGMSEFNYETKSWTPFIVSDNDKIQLEFIMLDPYYRLNLDLTSTNEKEAIYSTTFKIPDQHGMFKYRVEYKRPGYSYVTKETVVPVRHLANDEYPRSWEISNSTVYMAGYAVVVVAWMLFVFFYIFSGQKSLNQEKKDM